MLHATSSGGIALEVFTRQCAIDTECGSRSLGSGDDRQLHILDDVAGNKHAGHARGFILTAFDAPVPSELTAERLGEARLTRAGCIKEQRGASNLPAALKLDRLELPPVPTRRFIGSSITSMRF